MAAAGLAVPPPTTAMARRSILLAGREDSKGMTTTTTTTASLPASPAKKNLAAITKEGGQETSRPHRALPQPPPQRSSLPGTPGGKMTAEGSRQQQARSPRGLPKTPIMMASAVPIDPHRKTERYDTPPKIRMEEEREERHLVEPVQRIPASSPSSQKSHDSGHSPHHTHSTNSPIHRKSNDILTGFTIASSLRAPSPFKASPKSAKLSHPPVKQEPSQLPRRTHYSPTKFAEQVRLRGLKSKSDLHEKDRQPERMARMEITNNPEPISYQTHEQQSEGLGILMAPAHSIDLSGIPLERSKAETFPDIPSLMEIRSQLHTRSLSEKMEEQERAVLERESERKTSYTGPRKISNPIISSLKERTAAMEEMTMASPDARSSRIFSYSSILDSYDDGSEYDHGNPTIGLDSILLQERSLPETPPETPFNIQAQYDSNYSMESLQGLPRVAQENMEETDHCHLRMHEMHEEHLEGRQNTSTRQSFSSSVADSEGRQSYGMCSRSSQITHPTSHSAFSDTESNTYGTASALRKSIEDEKRRQRLREASMSDQDDYDLHQDHHEEEKREDVHNQYLPRDETTIFLDRRPREETQEWREPHSEYASPALGVGLADGGECDDSIDHQFQDEIDLLMKENNNSTSAINPPRHVRAYGDLSARNDSSRQVTPVPVRPLQAASRGLIQARDVSNSRTGPFDSPYGEARPTTARQPSSMPTSPSKMAPYRPSSFKRADDKRKLVVVGDGGTGKTALLIRYVRGTFPDKYIPTVFENYVTEVDYRKAPVELALWDTAGQEDYDRLRPLSYPDSHVVLICFSVNSEASFTNVAEKWAPEIIHFLPSIPVVLVALKTDLRGTSTSQQCITRDRGHRMAQEIGAAAYMECSAREGLGVDDVFEAALNVTFKDAVGSSTPKRRKKARTCKIL